MAYYLAVGSIGNDVRRLQEYLNVESSASLALDGVFGGDTKREVLRFRKKFGLPEAPTFDEQCALKSASRGYDFPKFDTTPSKASLSWPKKRPGLTSPSGALMQSKCGTINFVHQPVPGNAENIKITNNFVANNIVTVDVKQLRDCIVPIDDTSATKEDGRIPFHKDHADRLVSVFEDWEKAGLMDRVLTFLGSFNARLKRGATSATVANLSNHSWGTAFDINAAWNARKVIPAQMGDRGCVRELVAIGHDNGFYWGGHFGTKDGMHFEVAAEKL